MLPEGMFQSDTTAAAQSDDQQNLHLCLCLPGSNAPPARATALDPLPLPYEQWLKHDLARWSITAHASQTMKGRGTPPGIAPLSNMLHQ